MSYHPEWTDIAATLILAVFGLVAVVNPWHTYNAHVLARGFGAFAGALLAVFVLGFQTPTGVVVGLFAGGVLYGLMAGGRKRAGRRKGGRR